MAYLLQSDCFDFENDTSFARQHILVRNAHLLIKDALSKTTTKSALRRYVHGSKDVVDKVVNARRRLNGGASSKATMKDRTKAPKKDEKEKRDRSTIRRSDVQF